MNMLLDPFIVTGGVSKKLEFLVREIRGGITEEQVAMLLGRLSIDLEIRDESTPTGASIDEPVDVYAQGPIVSIYPAGKRVITNIKLYSWALANVVDQTEVVKARARITPKDVQVRTIIKFDPSIIGLGDWGSLLDGQLEVDICTYSKEKEHGEVCDVPITHDELVTEGQFKT